MLSTKFKVSWPFVGSGEEVKNRFPRWRPSWTSDWNDFKYFLSNVAPMLPTKFQVNWPFGSEAKNRLSRWLPRQPSWISDQNDFSYFLSISHPDASYQVLSLLAFLFRRRSKKQIFKMAATVIGTILAIFYKSP